MSEASKKSSQGNSLDSANAISSPDLESGPTRSGSQDGPMTDLFGREVAPVRPSRVREKERGLMTLATSGRLGLDSSASADLQRFLESNLMTRLDTAGSTLFNLTWKARRTPLGRRYLERAVSGRRTSVSVCTSVPTPNTPSGGPNTKSTATHTGGMDLDGAAMLAAVPTCKASDGQGGRTTKTEGGGNSHLDVTARLATVPTPMAGSPATETYNAAGNNDYSRRIVELAGVSTPQACSPNSLRGRGQDPEKRKAGGHAVNLQDQVTLATCATPKSEDSQCAGSHRGSPDTLHSQAQLADSGQTATGGTGATANIGQLNPEYSLWLMGLPIAFSNSVDTAMRLFRKSRKRSSKVSKTP